MNILFLGGDKRTKVMINGLKENHKIEVVGLNIDGVKNIKIEELNINNYKVIVFPITPIRDDYTVSGDTLVTIPKNILKPLANSSLVITGATSPALKEILRVYQGKIYNILSNVDVLKINSKATSEGIIADIINNTNISLYGANILLLGVGNVGEEVAKNLSSFGCNLYLYDQQIKNLDGTWLNNQSKLVNNLNKMDIIINTIPSPILDKKAISSLKKEVYILDISSSPYGFDFQYLKDINISNKLYPAIPMNIAYNTVGKVLTKCLKEEIL